MDVMIKGRTLETLYAVVACNTIVTNAYLFSDLDCQVPVGDDAWMTGNNYCNTAVRILYIGKRFFERFAQVLQPIGIDNFYEVDAAS